MKRWRATILRSFIFLNPYISGFSYLNTLARSIEGNYVFGKVANSNASVGFGCYRMLSPAGFPCWQCLESVKYSTSTRKSPGELRFVNEEEECKSQNNEDQLQISTLAESSNEKHELSLNSGYPGVENEGTIFQRTFKSNPNHTLNPTSMNGAGTKRNSKIKPNSCPSSKPKSQKTAKRNPRPSSKRNPDPAIGRRGFMRNPRPTVNPKPDGASIIQKIAKTIQSPNPDLEQTLNQLKVVLSQDLVLQVLSAYKDDSDSAMLFFTWAAKKPGYTHGTVCYNAMLDILGKYKRFTTMWQLVYQMQKKSCYMVTDETFTILIRRYASAHMVERAIETFYRRAEFGLKLNRLAFQDLLDALCKHRHAQEAEALMKLKQKEFPPDMKSHNIILNGWCGFPNLREAKRYWNELIRQGCKPNLITYTTFISAMAKKSKLNTALKLFETMWDKGCNPDVALCNAIVDALCLRKGIPEAFSVFAEMNERGCLPDVVTYNTLIKHICNSRRVDKAYELLDEMRRRGCAPNDRTYHYFLQVAERPEEALKVYQRMIKTGCMPTGDTYNLILKMLIGWKQVDRALLIWDDMDKNGIGPDRRSYTVMVHGFYEMGKSDEAYEYYKMMALKGILPEPKTKLFAKAIEINANDGKIGAYNAKKVTERNEKAQEN